MKKSCTVYRRGDRFVIHSHGFLGKGATTAIAPHLSCKVDCADTELGKLVMGAAAFSREITNEEAESIEFSPVLEAAEVPDWGTFIEGATTCTVEVGDREFTVIPYRKEVLYFTPIEHQTMTYSFPEDQAFEEREAFVGKRVRNCMEIFCW